MQEKSQGKINENALGHKGIRDMLTDIIQKKLKQLPEEPGIYKMLDGSGRIIYIGKSKCLKKRVNSYFVKEPRWEKVKKMSPFIQDIEYVVTDTHLEAMLLECRLIKEIRPFFNVIMKYDEKYVYLELGRDRRKNPLSVSRSKTEDAFGPVRSKRNLEELIDGMRNLYPLEEKDGSFFFNYHIFPVIMTEEEFLKNASVLEEICRNPAAMGNFIQAVEFHMQEAARKQKYEQAVRFRDLADRLRYLDKGLNACRELMNREIIYTVALDEGYKMFYISNGLLVYSQKTPDKGERCKNRLIREARKIREDVESQIPEKERIDYRSIIYWELLEADEDAITYLP